MHVPCGMQVPCSPPQFLHAARPRPRHRLLTLYGRAPRLRHGLLTLCGRALGRAVTVVARWVEVPGCAPSVCFKLLAAAWPARAKRPARGCN